MKLQDLLLDWYDHHQRSLPWRAKGEEIPNPYHVWLSEIMLQQTTVATVYDYFVRFVERWPTLKNLAEADLADVYHAWQGLGYYSRAKNLHRCAQLVMSEYQGMLPRRSDELLKLPGIGPYTAAAIAAIAFHELILPVDGNITRVIARVESLTTPLPQLKDVVQKWAEQHPPLRRPGDFAQSLMDLGSNICRPKTPECHRCPLQSICRSFEKGKQTQIPVVGSKKIKPTRYGQVFVCFNQKGQIQLSQRPSKGLLANLYEFPGTPWVEDQRFDEVDPSSYQVKHTFTHFHLLLQVIKRQTEKLLHEGCFWIHPQDLTHYALPTVMAKVWQEVAPFNPIPR